MPTKEQVKRLMRLRQKKVKKNKLFHVNINAIKEKITSIKKYKESKDYKSKKYEIVDNDAIVYFGKYNGMRISEIVTLNQSWPQFILDEWRTGRFKELKDDFIEILRHYAEDEVERDL